MNAPAWLFQLPSHPNPVPPRASLLRPLKSRCGGEPREKCHVHACDFGTDEEATPFY